ncbi:predicted protein [Nematostella vectensis]|uniref:Uncharacterized protein n=1 Tax=Nematostella vectensis TaxID=45351 RepID=A7S577_NEMVE|nr:uncharacterized protein LOC5512948 [Nematostella vectensis]EDO41154.1 predicted protein [Nematostella vectensis]|eukprot:XP_001633217.1 predicted protein [Nematostella vectensis]
MSEVNISLFTADGLRQDLEKSDRDLTTLGVVFTSASVKAGYWIAYKTKEYNPKAGDSVQKNIQILEPGDELDLNFNPGSIYSVPTTRQTAVVFEHAYYGGSRKAFDDYGCPDVTALFPPGDIGGASSLIINQTKKWELFTETQYKGLVKTEEPGWYATPEEMKFPNDRLKSIRPR